MKSLQEEAQIKQLFNLCRIEIFHSVDTEYILQCLQSIFCVYSVHSYVHTNIKTNEQINNQSKHTRIQTHLCIYICVLYLVLYYTTYLPYPYIPTYICAHMPSFLTVCEHTYIGGNTPPSLRGFENLTASYFNTPFHRYRQVLRRIRHLHWHPLAKSQV